MNLLTLFTILAVLYIIYDIYTDNQIANAFKGMPGFSFATYVDNSKFIETNMSRRCPQKYTIRIKKGRRAISKYLSMSNTFAQFCRGNVDEMYIMEQLADANDRLYLAFHNGAVKGFFVN